MSPILKNVGYCILTFIAKVLIRLRLIDNLVIVRIDGGICSQMLFYLVGMYFKEKGYRVKYSIDWFSTDGRDINGVFVRNFDLLKAFPDLVFEKSSRIENILYKAFKYKSTDRWMQSSPPCFLCGYYCLPNLPEYLARYFFLNLNSLDTTNRNLYNEILQRGNTVAVHVRRGDLSISLPAYGDPASIEYFRLAVNYIETNLKNSFYYFFSDEPHWVREFLINQLDIEGQYKIVDFNGSDKGFMDLMLIAACSHQITSQGSLGLYGAILNDNPSKIVICDKHSIRNRDILSSMRGIIYL